MNDPTDWTAVIERAFFTRLQELQNTDYINDSVRHQLAELGSVIDPLVTNPMDAANARFTALAVAAYNVLEPLRGPAEAAAIVQDCLNSPLRPDILAGTRGMLDQSGDPFAALVAVSKEREETYFGPSFRFERPVDDHDTYVLDVRRCFFHDVLTAAGFPELQAILCRFDLNWADAIDPAQHHTRFVRPVTFASGTTCRMLFTREERIG
ncbi:MAG TPA: L-2-amino-thiazoline-4-carboxylic acid hydrolase [Actinoplanes sp.]|nr:L-2-amino-thiazoline-4-carboxylic acid hydrolase [Actinoplanes sp.]